MGQLIRTIHNLAIEAKQDESKVIGRHRRPVDMQHKALYGAHNTAKHMIHIIVLTGTGLPAILAFEAARPLWARYVEAPLAEIMIGTDHVAAFLANCLSSLG